MNTFNFILYIYKKKLLAIKILNDKPSGTFIIRDSNSFQGAYGLALKVSQSDGNLDSIFVIDLLIL